ncbi:MAG: hypothetical protein QG670_2176 [Thermoproteota archaeon]|nr:hypothetical protein [Thermoproteota archaeon]
MKAIKIVLLVIGSIILLASFGLLIGGIVLYGANTSFTDNQGFISSANQKLATSSYVIAAKSQH